MSIKYLLATILDTNLLFRTCFVAGALTFQLINHPHHPPRTPPPRSDSNTDGSARTRSTPTTIPQRVGTMAKYNHFVCTFGNSQWQTPSHEWSSELLALERAGWRRTQDATHCHESGPQKNQWGVGHVTAARAQRDVAFMKMSCSSAPCNLLTRQLTKCCSELVAPSLLERTTYIRWSPSLQAGVIAN